MLVCFTSLRPSRGPPLFTADIAEFAAAADTIATGTVFSTIVDDPASAVEFLDAYLGAIMLEAASAADTVDGSFPSAATYATFDGTNTNVTLSNGNRTATHNASAIAGARSTAGKSSGKWYFEVTCTNMDTSSNTDCVGVVTAAGTYTNMTTTVWSTNCAVVRRFLNPDNGPIFSNDNPASVALGTDPTNQTVGVAVDLDNDRIWFRITPAGNWNGSGTANPATNTGGVSMSSYSATTVSPAIAYQAANSGQAFVLNAGQVAFNGSAPSGFSGWA